MFEEGKNHRNIHPVLTQEGCKGSENAVYQYMIKYAHENNIAYGHHSRVIPLEERNGQSVTSRPPRISIERTSRHTIYEGLLHAAAKRKEELTEALLGLEATVSNSPIKKDPSDLEEWVNKTSYADSIAKMIVDTRPKDKNAKKNEWGSIRTSWKSVFD